MNHEKSMTITGEGVMGDISDDHQAELRWTTGELGAMYDRAIIKSTRMMSEIQRRTSCKFCGKSPVQWIKKDGQAILFDKTGEHKCQRQNQGQPS